MISRKMAMLHDINFKERDEWISSLKKTLMLNEDRRRTDNSLKLDVLEIKGKYTVLFLEKYHGWNCVNTEKMILFIAFSHEMIFNK